MIFLRSVVLLFVLPGLLLACSQQVDETGKQEEATSTADDLVTNENASVTDRDYYHLKGKLADLEVTFDIIRQVNEAYPEEGYFMGFYRYNRYGGPIAVYGSIDTNGQLVLTEEGSWNQNAHQLKGEWSPQGTYSGIWYSGNGKDEHAFELSAADDEIVPFANASLTDSIRAIPDWERSPQATFSARWLVPKMADKQMEKYVEDIIKKGLAGTGIAAAAKDIKDALQVTKTAFFTDYQAEMASLSDEQETVDTTELSQTMFYYDYTKSMIVYYNTRALLTLGFTDYTYMGGAHGIYGTSVGSYDLLEQRQLQLSDVLLPGYEAAVSKALAQAIRTKYQLSDDAPLSEILFEDTIAGNENFGLTDKGIFFVYQPYEVAAYAVGEIELFVAFENIKDYVRADWL